VQINWQAEPNIGWHSTDYTALYLRR
jgi:hypothetical protein